MEKSLSLQKPSTLFFILSGLFIGNALLAELIGVKIFSMEHFLGVPPAQIPFPGRHINLDLSVGVVIWPLVFVISDLINEYFGRNGVRKVSYFTAIIIAYSSIILLIGTKLPPADFWTQLNQSDPAGNNFNINYAYSVIFRQGIGIIVGSITAFLISQMIDAYAFFYIKKITGHKKLWLRATGSTVISQLFDSFVILFIAFYLMGNWTFQQVISVGIVQYLYKISLAIILTPSLYIVHSIIDRYLGRNKTLAA